MTAWAGLEGGSSTGGIRFKVVLTFDDEEFEFAAKVAAAGAGAEAREGGLVGCGGVDNAGNGIGSAA